MPFELLLPKRLKAQGWKVKILDKERVEPPHVTVRCHAEAWRIGLRDGQFLVPPGGSARDLDPEIRRLLEVGWDALVRAWDARYPENPVSSGEEEI